MSQAALLCRFVGKENVGPLAELVAQVTETAIPSAQTTSHLDQGVARLLYRRQGVEENALAQAAG